MTPIVDAFMRYLRWHDAWLKEMMADYPEEMARRGHPLARAEVPPLPDNERKDVSDD